MQFFPPFWQAATVMIVCFRKFMNNDDVNYTHDYLITLIDSSIQQTWDEPQCRNALLSTCFWPGGDLIRGWHWWSGQSGSSPHGAYSLVSANDKQVNKQMIYRWESRWVHERKRRFSGEAMGWQIWSRSAKETGSQGCVATECDPEAVSWPCAFTKLLKRLLPKNSCPPCSE